MAIPVNAILHNASMYIKIKGQHPIHPGTLAESSFKGAIHGEAGLALTSQPAESSMLSSSTLLDFPVTRSVNLQGIVSSAFWLYWPEEIKAKMTRNNCQVECKRLGTVIGSSAKGGDLTFPSCHL